MDCPCCTPNSKNKLTGKKGNIVDCVRGHKFEVFLDGLKRKLRFISGTTCNCKPGDVFEIPDDVGF